MRQFADRVAVITGAASGIGRALAERLAARGCVLALADNDAAGLTESRRRVEQLGAHCSVHALDVADRIAMEAFSNAVAERHGGVHLLFNNAGVALVDSIESLDYDDFNWLMNINFWGVVYGCKAFLPYLQQVDRAHIVNVSSLFGLMSLPTQAAYNASKFAVRGFTECLRMELADTTIGVSCVHPGGIKTAIVSNSRVRSNASRAELSAEFEQAARTTAARAAAKIIRGVEKNKRRILIGPDARIADWVVRLFPASYEKVLRLQNGARRLQKLHQERIGEGSH